MPSASALLAGGDPAVAGNFLLEIDGVEIGIFREVKGLEFSVKVEEIREGGQNQYVYQAPGRLEWPHIVFRRGMTHGDSLFDWMSKSSGVGYAGNHNKLTRCTGAISAITMAGERLRSWEIVDVYPVKWRGPDFASGSLASLEEELEIAHHGFTSTTH